MGCSPEYFRAPRQRTRISALVESIVGVRRLRRHASSRSSSGRHSRTRDPASNCRRAMPCWSRVVGLAMASTCPRVPADADDAAGSPVDSPAQVSYGQNNQTQSRPRVVDSRKPPPGATQTASGACVFGLECQSSPSPSIISVTPSTSQHRPDSRRSSRGAAWRWLPGRPGVAACSAGRDRRPDCSRRPCSRA